MVICQHGHCKPLFGLDTLMQSFNLGGTIVPTVKPITLPALPTLPTKPPMDILNLINPTNPFGNIPQQKPANTELITFQLPSVNGGTKTSGAYLVQMNLLENLLG